MGRKYLEEETWGVSVVFSRKYLVYRPMAEKQFRYIQLRAKRRVSNPPPQDAVILRLAERTLCETAALLDVRYETATLLDLRCEIVGRKSFGIV